MWWRKRHMQVPADLDEARKIQAEQRVELERVRTQDVYVQRLTSRLINRRAQNHFGDSIQVTFTRRGGHHA